jgi:hypothetical protein
MHFLCYCVSELESRLEFKLPYRVTNAELLAGAVVGAA